MIQISCQAIFNFDFFCLIREPNSLTPILTESHALYARFSSLSTGSTRTTKKKSRVNNIQLPFNHNPEFLITAEYFIQYEHGSHQRLVRRKEKRDE